MRSYLTPLVLIIAAIAFGCADPAANKPKATVGNAQPESNSAKSGATETLAILSYEQGFKYYNLGTGSTIAVLMVIVSAVLVAAYFSLLRREAT